MGFISYDNKIGGGAFTGTFSASPPVANLSTPQTPSPHAEFDGAAADFTFTPAAPITFRCLALIGHTLPDGAVITWRDEADALIATQTWNRFKNRPANSIILLDNPETVSALKCEITNAGTGTKRVAAAFAGDVLEFEQEAGTRFLGQSDASIVRIGGTDWAFAGTRRRGIPVAAFGNRGSILGVNFDGTEYSGTDWVTVLTTVGLYGTVIVTPSAKSQATIDALSIYGSVDSIGEPSQVDGDVFKVAFSVVESR